MKRDELLATFKDPIKVLDKGFVRLVDVMGDDSSVVQSARVSYGKGTKTAREDRGLIRYLMRNQHSSPLEMCEIKLHCKMPIFVARQFVRHRTANLNEYSARYSELPDEFYIPDHKRLNPQGGASSQSSNENKIVENAKEVRWDIENSQEESFTTYRSLLDRKLSREVARIVTPMGTYTQWYWKIDLRNLLHFLELRMDPHAQWEIRQYANAIAEIVKDWVPHVWEAFEDFVLNAVTFSGPEIKEIKRFLPYKARLDAGELKSGDPEVPLRCADSGLSKGEMKEFADKLQKVMQLSYQMWTDYKPE